MSADGALDRPGTSIVEYPVQNVVRVGLDCLRSVGNQSAGREKPIDSVLEEIIFDVGAWANHDGIAWLRRGLGRTECFEWSLSLIDIKHICGRDSIDLKILSV